MAVRVRPRLPYFELDYMSSFKKKNILITGGAGFIGTNLCLSLHKQGANIYCLDSLYTGHKRNILQFKNKKNFTFIHHDIIDRLKLNKSIDYIFHLACPASPPAYQKNPIYTLNTCFNGTLNILELAKKKNSKILFSSTSEIYGDPLIHPQKETYFGNVNTLGPRSCYDEGKRIGEVLFTEFFNKYNLDIRIARIFNTYGPFMNKNDGRVVSNFINQAIRNEDITIFGKGEQTRSFCYIDDMINGLNLLAKSKKYLGPINLGNPKEYNMQQFANIILKLIKNSKSNIVFKDLPQDDPRKRRPDITLAKKKLNWCPKININIGLKKTIDYYLNFLD